MIGNMDWGLIFFKNVKYFNRGNKVILVFYDFDFVVIVDVFYVVLKEDNFGDYYYGRLYWGFKEEMNVL